MIRKPDPFGYGAGYGYYQAPPPPPPQPKSQADCPSGTKFKFREENDGYGNSKQIAYCGEPESQADCPDGTTFIQGRSSDGMQMVYTPSKCKKTIGRPDLSEDTPTPSVSPKNYFWLYAIAVGVGFYLLTRKKSV